MTLKFTAPFQGEQYRLSAGRLMNGFDGVLEREDGARVDDWGGRGWMLFDGIQNQVTVNSRKEAQYG